MKIILTSTFVLFTLIGFAQKPQTFGAKVKEKGAISTSEFLTQIEGKDSLFTKVKVDINEACQKKGCWMNVDLGKGNDMMVRFKDYGFFVPKDSGGSTAIIEGVAYREVVSVDMLRHYAEDAGKSEEEIAKINSPETKLSFEATGVLIYPPKK